MIGEVKDLRTAGKIDVNFLHRFTVAMFGGGYAYLLKQTYEQLSISWSYLGFWYVEQPLSVTLFSIMASAVLGSLLPITNWTIVGFAKWVLYFLLFIPALVIPPQQGALPVDSLIVLESLVWISAALLILFLRNGMCTPRNALKTR